MNALDSVVSVRSTYMPKGPRGDYHPEHQAYRRDDEQRERCAQKGTPPAPAHQAKDPSPDASTHVPCGTNLKEVTAPLYPPEGGGFQPERGFDEAPLSGLTKKERITDAVRRGHTTYAEISSATGLSKSEVSAIIHATLLVTRQSRPAVLEEITPAGSQVRRFRISGETCGDGGSGVALATDGITQPGQSNEETQIARVLAAVVQGAHTHTEIHKHTDLGRTAVTKAVSHLVRRGKLRDLPRAADGERTVEVQPPPPLSMCESSAGRKLLQDLAAGNERNRSAARRGRSRRKLLQDLPAGNERDIALDPPPAASPITSSPSRQAPESPDSPPSLLSTGESIDLLQNEPMGALEKLREVISRLADLAHENAVYRDKLVAVQELLANQGGTR